MSFVTVLLAVWAVLAAVCSCQSGGDATVMQALKKSLNVPNALGWSDPNPCLWQHVKCNGARVTRIQIGHQNLVGSLPPNMNNLTALQVFEIQGNQISGPLPSFSGMSSLQSLILSNNGFTSIPVDFFDGLNALQNAYLDSNPFSAWAIPKGLSSASTLQTFSANSANVSGPFPEFLGAETFSSLTSLHLSFNNLEGPLPSSLAGSSMQSLWLNGQHSSSRMNGSLTVLQNMTQLTEAWLHGNSFSGPLPDFSGLVELQNLSIRDNSLTGPVPGSLVGLRSLVVVNLTNNLLQGETPGFSNGVQVDLDVNSNSFCLPTPGVECDSRVNLLLNVLSDFGYPASFAQNWKGNDPCASWIGITCNNRNISVINFHGMGLNGVISPSFSQITSLQRLVLSNNNISGTIPSELTSLPNLVQLDVSNNQIYGTVPTFLSGVVLNTDGNVNIGKNASPSNSNGGSGTSPGDNGSADGNGRKPSTGKIVGSVVGSVGAFLFVGAMVFFFARTKTKRTGRLQIPYTTVIHPRHSGSDDAVKITVAGSGTNYAPSQTHSQDGSGQNDIQIVEAGNMVISIQVLRNVTDNFSEKNILGRGGFGTVYKGELHDGTKIAVKRMEAGVITDKGLEEFKSEIAVLTKVRHRHLVALLGYCLDGNERLLVYEYMPQGTLSRFLFNWKEEALKPLEWMKRLTIVLDVARGVEYLHGLAQQSFIHRDLKPSNILLGDDMRAKVADFGLVRLAPDDKASVATKLAGTFGYLAPEYAVTGRVSTKIDVYSFGVILMEIITGRKALDETQGEEIQHLVPWFRRMLLNKENLHKAIDPIMELSEESLASITTVAKLAGHCTAREPYQRPDMGHVVNVLSSLAELWKPSEPTDPVDLLGIDYEMTLPQVLKKWQTLEGFSGVDASSSTYIDSGDSTQTSIPIKPAGFADSFTSSDGR